MLSRLLSPTATSPFLRSPLARRYMSTTTSKMAINADSKVLIYLMRRDLRVSDNPIFHHLATQEDHGFTHVIPVCVLSATQIEVSGFIKGTEKCPYPEAKSPQGGFWRCGPHRAKFLAEAVWNLKENLERVGSGLMIRVGRNGEIIEQLLKELKISKPGAVWMTGEETSEEKEEEDDVKEACKSAGVDFRLWHDEKYFVDDRDLKKLKNPSDLPDVFTTYRKMMEPLREAPRAAFPGITKDDKLPAFPSESIPEQPLPFTIPTKSDDFLEALLKPLMEDSIITDPPTFPEGAITVHPFIGGETHGLERLEHLIKSGSISTYKETRNGMLGTEFSSKLSAYLAIGCMTARQTHAAMLDLENGSNPAYESAPGYGKGENPGTQGMRFELLWRDYMRLCTRKYGSKLFYLGGFKQRSDARDKWSTPADPKEGRSSDEIIEALDRFLNGTTGMGLIDASQREIYHTGYTSNRARQNVASFFAKHLYLDWRIGAEWYESMLVDYDVSSNWGNWQYVAGVGNDPRDDLRVFNPVKQSFDYDPQGEYVKMWVQELRGLEAPGEVFQCWTVDAKERASKGLGGNIMCDKPLRKIDFTVGRRAPHGRGRSGRGRGGRGRGSGGSGGAGGGGGGRGGGEGYNQWQSNRGASYGGRGYGSSRGHFTGNGQYNGSILYRGQGGGAGYQGSFGYQGNGFPGTDYHRSGAQGGHGYQGVPYQGGGGGFEHHGGGNDHGQSEYHQHYQQGAPISQA